jgi:pimeloyl-ACP methyl ester carboxylesterase
VLCGVLRRAGIWAEDLRCMGDAWILRHLASLRRAGRPFGPLILVGHSCGGRAALFAARELDKIGVAVDLIVCVDVALPPEVAGNVRCAVNLYRTRWRLYPAGALRAAPGSKVHIDNIDLDERGHEGWLHHLNFRDSAVVQALVLGGIFGILDEFGERKVQAA